MSGNKKLKILFVNGGFSHDLRAMSEANPGHEIKEMKHETIAGFANQLFPEDLRAHLDWNVDDEAKIPPELLGKWIEYNTTLLAAVRKQFPFDIFVTPSDLFYWIRHFIRIARQQGIPTLYLEKEGTRCDYLMRPEITGWHKQHMPLISDAIVVPTERQRQWWLGCGAEPEKITVAGQPRFDIYHKAPLRRPLDQFGVRVQPGRKMLFLLAWHSNCCCVMPQEYYREELWDKVMRPQVVETILSFMRRHRDVDLVVKFHPRQAELGDADVLEKQLGSDPSLPITIVRGTEGAAELILRADAVVGYFSTAVSEAMAIGKPVIYTFWKELQEQFVERTLMHHTSGGCDVATNSAELDAHLERALYRPETIPDRTRAQFEHAMTHLGPVDGRNGERCWAAIEQFWKKWESQKLETPPASLDFVETLEKMKG